MLDISPFLQNEIFLDKFITLIPLKGPIGTLTLFKLFASCFEMLGYIPIHVITKNMYMNVMNFHIMYV